MQTESLTQAEKIADLKAFARQIEIQYFGGNVDNWLCQNFPDEFPAQLNSAEAQE